MHRFWCFGAALACGETAEQETLDFVEGDRLAENGDVGRQAALDHFLAIDGADHDDVHARQIRIGTQATDHFEAIHARQWRWAARRY